MEDLFKENPQTEQETQEDIQAAEVCYKSPGDDNTQPVAPKKRRSSGAGCFLIFALIVLCSLFAFAICISLFGNLPFLPKSDDNASVSTPEPTISALPQESVTPGGYTAPVTPSPTQRPMTQYDGTAPVISDTANPFPEIISSVQGGVVSVLNYGKSKSLFGGSSDETLIGSGSGFVISSEGYCVTNAHVIEDAMRVTLVLSDDREIPCEVIGSDVSTDVAVLRFDNSNLHIQPLYLGNSDTAKVGEFVITVGDPSGRELAGTITFGIISAVNREVNIDGRRNTYIQTDAAMNPGNSGGPLINSKGEVIGVNSAKTVTASYDEFGQAISAEGLGFAIPINTVKSIVESLITQGRIVRPGIGVTIRPATDEELAAAKLSYGLYVNSTVEGGPCYAAGIKTGDILISCNGTELHENDDLVKYVQAGKVGDVINITLKRGNDTLTVSVVIGDLNNM